MYIKTARKGKSETLTVSSSVVTLTADNYNPAPGVLTGAVQALITVEDGAIRFSVDGVDPDPATKVGHPVASGGQMVIEGQANIASLKMIAESTDATVNVTYF